MSLLFKLLFLPLIFSQTLIGQENQYEIVKGNVVYDFNLSNLSCKFIEKGDSNIFSLILSTEGINLLYSHALWSGNIDSNISISEFAKLIINKNNKIEILENIKINNKYAIDSIANTDYPQKICLNYLPKGFLFSSRLYFTVGYDLGIVFNKNSTINIAHKKYLENISELKYYSIHELHHAGFIAIKKFMPSLKIKTYGEMSKLIEYFTHLEGMAVYAAYDERKRNNALSNDSDYIILNDSLIMDTLINRYFEIYKHFLSNELDTLRETDWKMLNELSSNNRLWYRVGSKMAELIDKKYGREKLTGLIEEPSQNFINTYLNAIKE